MGYILGCPCWGTREPGAWCRHLHDSRQRGFRAETSPKSTMDCVLCGEEQHAFKRRAPRGNKPWSELSSEVKRTVVAAASAGLGGSVVLHFVRLVCGNVLNLRIRL